MDWDFGSHDDFLGDIDVPLDGAPEPKWFTLQANSKKSQPKGGVKGEILLTIHAGNQPAATLTSGKISEIKMRVANSTILLSDFF